MGIFAAKRGVLKFAESSGRDATTAVGKGKPNRPVEITAFGNFALNVKKSFETRYRGHTNVRAGVKSSEPEGFANAYCSRGSAQKSQKRRLAHGHSPAGQTVDRMYFTWQIHNPSRKTWAERAAISEKS
jgi:hypothetical protein